MIWSWLHATRPACWRCLFWFGESESGSSFFIDRLVPGWFHDITESGFGYRTWLKSPWNTCLEPNHHHHHNRFMALFPGPPGWTGAKREILDFTVQGEINRGRHTNHPDGRHSIRTNHPPYFLRGRCTSCRPTNSVKALKATSAFRLGRRC